MKANLWIYANNQEQQAAAASLVVFGAEVFHKAKLIKDLPLLNTLRLELDKYKSGPAPLPKEIVEFSLEYLIDCVRILVFFENYMKAELIVRNFCVHSINKDYAQFKDLAKQQFKKPIDLKEIETIQPFEVNQSKKLITHPAVKETTIGFNTLVGSSAYLQHYQLSEKLVGHIKEINLYRNKLHLHRTIEFKLSEEFITKIQSLVDFVNTTINTRVG